MPANTVPLAKLSLVYDRKEKSKRSAGNSLAGRFLLWTFGLALAAAIYWGVPAFFKWPHVISSTGGHYFVNRIAIPVPFFKQADPRWTFELLGPTVDTIGSAGCAITSASMVLSAYGVDIDPQRLNQYLNLHEGYTPQGWVYWEKAAAFAPFSQVELAYEDPPSYALIDSNLLAGNPVIVRLTLASGMTHFVVVVGKEGWDYLIEDPARGEAGGVYPLKRIAAEIKALRFYRVVPPTFPPAPIIVPPVSPVLPLAPAPVTTPPPTLPPH